MEGGGAVFSPFSSDAGIRFEVCIFSFYFVPVKLCKCVFVCGVEWRKKESFFQNIVWVCVAHFPSFSFSFPSSHARLFKSSSIPSFLFLPLGL